MFGNSAWEKTSSIKSTRRFSSVRFDGTQCISGCFASIILHRSQARNVSYLSNKTYVILNRDSHMYVSYLIAMWYLVPISISFSQGYIFRQKKSPSHQIILSWEDFYFYARRCLSLFSDLKTPPPLREAWQKYPNPRPPVQRE